MNDYPGSLPPAGWYPDPYGSPIERWWDGQGWTEHMNTPVEPPVPPAYEPPPLVQPTYEAPVQADPSPHPYAAPQQIHPQPMHFPEMQLPEPLRYPGLQQYAEPVPYPEPAAYPGPVQYAAPTQYPEPTPYPEPVQYAAPAQYPQYSDPIQQGAARSDTDSDFSRILTGESDGRRSTGGFDEEAFSHWSNEDYEEPPRNPAATAGLTFGVLSIPLPGIGGILGLIFSIIGLGRASRAARENGEAVGRGKAVAGLVLSLVGTAAAGAILMVLFPGLLGTLLGTASTADDAGSTDSLVNDAILTQNGNVALEVGAVGTIPFPDTTDPAISFTVTAIEPNTTCTADPSVVLSPENGQFLAVTVQFDTAAGYESVLASGGLLQPNSADWVGYLDDGTMITNTDAGSSCIPEEEQLPLEIASGSTVTGTVILDMTADVTAFSWSPAGVTNVDPTLNRWEWPAV